MPDKFDDDRDQKKTKPKPKENRPKRGKPILLMAMAIVAVAWGTLVLAAAGLFAYLAIKASPQSGAELGPQRIYLGIRSAVLLVSGASIAGGGFLLWKRWAAAQLLVLGPSWFLLLNSMFGLCGLLCAFPVNLGIPNEVLTADAIAMLVILAIVGFLTICQYNETVRRHLRE